MADHASLTGASLHEPKGVASAAANTVYIADGAGSGAWSLPTGSYANVVIVAAATDFPTPVSDVITLAADTLYMLDGDIDIGNDRFVLSSNSAIRGLDSSLSSITTTTTGNVFTASGSFHLDSFTLTATSGTVFALTGGASESSYIRNFTVASCSSMGTATAWYSFVWHKGTVSTTTTGLSFAGSCTTCIIDSVDFAAGYTTGINFGAATFNTLAIRHCTFGNASATNHMLVAASGANLNSAMVGRISSCDFKSGASNMVNGLAVGDTAWLVDGNKNVSNSAKSAQAYMQTTTTTTISVGIGDSGNPIIVNGSTNWVDANSDQFTVTTGGRVTYTGISPAVFKVSCSIYGTTSASGDTLRHYIAKNGTIVQASMTEHVYASTAVSSPSPCSAVLSLSNGDYVELFVENTTGTNNWDSHVLNMVVGEV